MAVLGSMVASLSLESASFMSGMRKAADETSRTQKAIQANLDRITTGVQTLAAVMAVDVFAAATKAALDYADAIVDLADRTGASTKFIQEFGSAAQLAGSDVETARTGIEKFSKAVGDAANGNEAAREKLAKYGITAMDVDTAVKQASATISKMDSPATQLAATMDLFGKKAGTLTQTLAGGTEGLELQARAARDLGIVLEDSVVRNAGQANDKLDTMKMILDAKMAGAIAQNADSLVSLADSIMKVTGAILDFWKSNPTATLSIIGALAGARVGGVYGAAVGAVAGGVAGIAVGKSQAAADNNLDLRTRSLRQATTQMRRYSGDKDSHLYKVWKERFDNERAYMDRALKAHADAQKPKTPTQPSDLGSIPLPKATANRPKSGRSSAELAQKEAERLARYNTDVLRGQLDIIRGGGIYDGAADLDYYKNLVRLAATDRKTMKDGDDITVNGIQLDRQSRLHQEAMLGGDLDIKYDVIRKEIQSRYEEQLSQLDKSIAKGDIREGSEAEAVRAQLIYQKLLEDNAASWDERVERQKQASDAELTQLGIQKDTLSLQSSLASTAADRRRIALQMLDLETRERDKALEAQQIGLDPSTQRYKDIQSQRDALQNQSSLMREGVMKNTMGPIEGFLDAIPKSASEANEALQNIAVQGLASLNEGIVDAIMGAKSFGDAFEEVSKQVIKALLNMAVQMAVIQPIANVLGSALGVPLPAKANGGLSSGGLTLVGERGAEVVDLPGGSNVIPHHALNSVSGRGGGNVINIDARGSTDEAAVHEAVVRGIAQAMPQIRADAISSTYRKLGRPVM